MGAQRSETAFDYWVPVSSLSSACSIATRISQTELLTPSTSADTSVARPAYRWARIHTGHRLATRPDMQPWLTLHQR